MEKRLHDVNENRTMDLNSMGIIFHLLEFRNATKSPVPFFPTHVCHQMLSFVFFSRFRPDAACKPNTVWNIVRGRVVCYYARRDANGKMPNRYVRLLLFILWVCSCRSSSIVKRGKCIACNATPAYVSFFISFISCLRLGARCYAEGCRFG